MVTPFMLNGPGCRPWVPAEIPRWTPGHLALSPSWMEGFSLRGPDGSLLCLLALAVTGRTYACTQYIADLGDTAECLC